MGLFGDTSCTDLDLRLFISQRQEGLGRGKGDRQLSGPLGPDHSLSHLQGREQLAHSNDPPPAPRLPAAARGA